MFNQQSGGLGQPGMHIQQQPNQVSAGNMQQMQQQGMVSMNTQQHQSMMGQAQQQQLVANAPQQTMGVIGQQHSLGGPGHPQQMTSIRPQLSLASMNPQQQNVMIKQEAGTITMQNIQQGQIQGQVHVQQQHRIQPMQVTQPQAQAPPQQDTSGASAPIPVITDPIARVKQLMPQLKECLVNLISVARQNFVANARIDNLDKPLDTSLMPRFDKSLEHFYALCNQIELNLSLANEQISQTLVSMQQTPLITNQMKENSNNMQVYPSYILTVRQQLAYAKEIQNLLLERSSKLEASFSTGAIGKRP